VFQYLPNGRWEVESCIRNRKAVDPLVVSLEETCEVSRLAICTEIKLYMLFQKELYNFESLYKFIQRTYTTF
jgi:hypothetical protein